MSTQMTSDLLVDLSAEEQQLLAGGVFGERDGDGDEDGGDSGRGGEGRLYRITSTAIVRVRPLTR